MRSRRPRPRSRQYASPCRLQPSSSPRGGPYHCQRQVWGRFLPQRAVASWPPSCKEGDRRTAEKGATKSAQTSNRVVYLSTIVVLQHISAQTLLGVRNKCECDDLFWRPKPPLNNSAPSHLRKSTKTYEHDNSAQMNSPAVRTKPPELRAITQHIGYTFT